MILILSCSLNSDSYSRILAGEILRYCEKVNQPAELIDMREYPLPHCDGERAYGDPHVQTLAKKIYQAQAIIIAGPIYNYDLNAVAKNLLELTGQNWRDKVVGFAVSAGGHNSYMSVMGMANSLMLDFRCLIIPRFVYATEKAFSEGAIIDPEIVTRVEQLTTQTIQISQAIANKTV
jgi:FMN reductase